METIEQVNISTQTAGYLRRFNMGKPLFMPLDYTPKTERKKVEEPTIEPQPCMVCGKVIPGPYGRWAQGWTCSRICEIKYKEQP